MSVPSVVLNEVKNLKTTLLQKILRVAQDDTWDDGLNLKPPIGQSYIGGIPLTVIRSLARDCVIIAP